MITINLLPESYRPSSAGSIRQFPRSPLALMLGAALLSVAVMLGGWAAVNQIRLGRAQARLQVLAPKKTEIDALKASIASLQRQAKALEETDRQRSAWAPRLNAIADLTPLGVWFTDLALDPQKLVLKGAVLKQHGDEMTAVNRLVSDLKQDARLAPALADVQLSEIRNVQDGQIDVMEFTLTCHLSGVPAGAGK